MRKYTWLIAAVCVSLAAVHAAQLPAKQHIEDLDHPRASVRADAARELARLESRTAVPPLIEALNDSSAKVRREAARALGHIKAKSAADALVDALEDPDRDVRFYAAYALGEIRPEEAVEPLVKALEDPAWTVRDQAAWALREIHEATDADLVGPLVRRMRHEDADVEHLTWLVQHVGGAKAVDEITGLLDSDDVTVRLRALGVLVDIGGKPVLKPLIDALDDPSAKVRLAAVKALRDIGNKKALDPIRKLAADAKNEKVKQAAEKAAYEMSVRSDLAAHWSFDESDGDTAKDASGNGIDGAIKGCPRVEGKVGKALRFSPGKYVELGKPPGLPIANRPLTFMAWAKPEAENGVVIARGGGFTGFSLYIMDGVPKFGIHRTKEGPAYIAAAERKVGDGWVHLAGVVKEDRIELYVDGKLAATKETKGLIPGNAGQPMEIGYDVSNSAAEITDNFEGLIDEVKVFNAALNAEQIRRMAPLK